MSKKGSNKKPISAIVIIPIVIIAVLLAAVVAFVFFVPIMHNDCDSLCSESGPYMSCPAVCVKTYRTTWDVITNQRHVIGY